jgi:hypothetical protein
MLILAQLISKRSNTGIADFSWRVPGLHWRQKLRKAQQM